MPSTTNTRAFLRTARRGWCKYVFLSNKYRQFYIEAPQKNALNSYLPVVFANL